MEWMIKSSYHVKDKIEFHDKEEGIIIARFWIKGLLVHDNAEDDQSPSYHIVQTLFKIENKDHRTRISIKPAQLESLSSSSKDSEIKDLFNLVVESILESYNQYMNESVEF